MKALIEGESAVARTSEPTEPSEDANERPRGNYTPLLDGIRNPEDLRRLPESDLKQLADELRRELVDAVSVTGGHLGAGLGVVRSDLPEGLLVQSVMALVEVCDRYFLETWAQYDRVERRALVAQQMALLRRVCLADGDPVVLRPGEQEKGRPGGGPVR